MPFETVFVGVVIALIYTELTGVYPGGLIVPAFLALTLDRPVRALAVVAIAVLSVIVYRAAAQRFILFGRRRFVALVLLGGLWAQVWWLVAPSLFPGPASLRVLGWVVPGLLANNLERQKPGPTLASLVVVTVLTYFVTAALTLLGR